MMNFNKLIRLLGVCMLAAAVGGCAPVYAQEEPLVIPTLVTPVMLQSTTTPLPIAYTPPAPTPTITTTPTVDPTLAYSDQGQFILGQSVNGTEITGWRLRGSDQAEVSLVLIGGIHGGYEANTVILAERLLTYFRINPDEILPEVELIIIPNANPDGLEAGRGLEGRFNANGVDLNRNWGCEWAETAYLGQREVNPGPFPFSEPETVALRDFFTVIEPNAVLFYHSQLGGIFLGECGSGEAALWLGETLSKATGYPLYDDFTFYEVTGDATNWLAERGIPAAVVELYTKEDAEFDANFAGVMALQCRFSTPSSAEYQRLCQ